jgi:hypothetical protein
MTGWCVQVDGFGLWQWVHCGGMLMVGSVERFRVVVVLVVVLDSLV